MVSLIKRMAPVLAGFAVLIASTTQVQSSETVLRVETYNVGLAHGFVDYAEQRAPAIWDAVAKSDADVVCLQEVWTDDDRDDAVDALAGSHPHAWLTENAQKKASKSPVCKRKDLFGEGKFVSCLTGSCGGLEGDALTNCIIDQCEPIMNELKNDKPECANALMAQVGKSAPAALWTVVRPIRKAGVFAYDGSDGLVMVSKYPLANTGMVDFTDKSTLNRRRALYADVQTGDTTTRVYCTHLTADLDGIAPYPGPFASWNDENLNQVNELIEHANAFAGPAVLLGDFNCSLPDEQSGVKGESDASCQAFLDAGFSDPIMDLHDCTYCEGNTLVGQDSGGDKLLDHAFIKGWQGQDGARTYDGTATIAAGEHSLSDHYGYAVSLGPIPLPPEPEPEPEPEFECEEGDDGCVEPAEGPPNSGDPVE